MGESKQKGKILRDGKYLKILAGRFVAVVVLFSLFHFEIKSVYVLEDSYRFRIGILQPQPKKFQKYKKAVAYIGSPIFQNKMPKITNHEGKGHANDMSLNCELLIKILQTLKVNTLNTKLYLQCIYYPYNRSFLPTYKIHLQNNKKLL